MTDHELELNEDNMEVQDSTGAPVERKLYRVTEKAENGLFKNGETYKPGQTLELAESTAKGFLDLGEVELVDDGGQNA